VWTHLKAKKSPRWKKPPKNCVHRVHVSEYVLNSMFQVGYSRTLVLFWSIVIELISLSDQYATVRCANGQSSQLLITHSTARRARIHLDYCQSISLSILAKLFPQALPPLFMVEKEEKIHRCLLITVIWQYRPCEEHRRPILTQENPWTCVVIPAPFIWCGGKDPHIKADGLLKHIWIVSFKIHCGGVQSQNDEDCVNVQICLVLTVCICVYLSEPAIHIL